MKKNGQDKLASLMTNRFMKWLHDGRGEKLIPHSRSSEKHKKRQIRGRDKSVSYVFHYNTSPLWHLMNSRTKMLLTCYFRGRKCMNKIGRDKLASLMTNRFLKWLHDGRGERQITSVIMR